MAPFPQQIRLMAMALAIAATAPWLGAQGSGDPGGTADALNQYVAHAENEVRLAAAAPVDVVIPDPNGDAEPRPAMPVEVAQNVSGTGDEAMQVNPDETIALDFEDSEQDILTRQALEKLDVIVESLEFANADLRNVIRIIGERLDINFIFDADDIGGKVSLRLHNVRLRDALESILSTRKLAIVPDQSGIFRIVPQEQIGRQLVETRTEVIQLNWLSADDVLETMEPFLTDHGRMMANEESNTLIITDVPPQIQVIRDLIAEIDLAERQVLIEARLADINVGALRNLGTQWSVTKLNEHALRRLDSRSMDKDSTGLFGPAGVNNVETVTRDMYLGGNLIGSTEVTGLAGAVEALDPTPLANAGGLIPVLLEGFTLGGGLGSLSFGDKIGIFGDEYDLNATFSFLEQRDIVEVLANPRVTTLNNVPARIDIIEKIPYIESVQGPTEGVVIGEIEFEPVGVTINVKPIITPNGFVRMEIDLRQKIFRGRVDAGGGGFSAYDPPQVDERNAMTNVIVRNADTVALGGFRQVRKVEGVDGVPWLHRIPVIGWLFKNKEHDQAKTELVLMLTPKIVEQHVALNDREKYLYEKIDHDWHVPDKFFDETLGADEKDQQARRAARFGKVN